MPAREIPTCTSSRVQRATRLNLLEQARLQQRLVLLEKARLRQARLTNQEIRVMSTALDYILNSSGHSFESQEPTTQEAEDASQSGDMLFLYGERVASRKVRRISRQVSVTERPTSRHGSNQSSSSSVSGANGSAALPLRPQSCPARDRTFITQFASKENGPTRTRSDSCSETTSSRNSSVVSSSYRASSVGELDKNTSGRRRETPRQVWEDDTHIITKKILKAQHQQQQSQQQKSRLCRLYKQDIDRMRSQNYRNGIVRNSSTTYISFPTPRVFPNTAVPITHIQDLPKPASANPKRGKASSCKDKAE